jgi:TRAP-type mannitol/chloroaromatic compound transport system substrate-binding protein
MRRLLFGFGAFVATAMLAATAMAQQAQTRVLKIQTSWPATSQAYDQVVAFGKRLEVVSAGRLKIEAMPAGQVVPAFEVLDATSKRVVDGAHTWPGYWVGKNKAAILFTGGPGGPFGMDLIDYMSWRWHGGGFDMFQKFYTETLKLNVYSIPMHTQSPQALGWFKRKIENVSDFKGQRCRETGIAQEVFNEMGMRTVNMPGGEIMPAADRGVIDCAEWVGGIDDLKFGFHTIWKWHYAPSLHEPVSIGELMFNGDVWKELGPENQELIKTVAWETLFWHWAKWQRLNAEAVEEFRTKHGVNIMQTPPDILEDFLKAWDRVAQRESDRNPLFKEVYESQRKWASVTVPMKKFYFPPYKLAADHYWPDKTN